MRTAVVILTVVVGAAAPAYALRDHQHCWRVSDPLGLKGVVDVTAPQLGLVASGCKLGKAALFCDPAAKSVTSANVPLFPVSGRGLLDPRICYRLHCGAPYPPDQAVTDQFGTRVLTTLRPKMLCAPAVTGPPATTMDGLDHLACYKANDPLKLKGTVDVDTLDLGTKAGCRIRRSKLFCVPASVAITSVNVGPLLPIGGSGLDDDRVCYPVSCSKPYPGPQLASDEFASRTFTGLAPRLLCTPAPVALTTTTTVTTTTVTSTTFPTSDPSLLCQRAIEADGMVYARTVLDRIETCTQPGGSTSLTACMNTAAVTNALAQVRTQWDTDTGPACTGVDPRAQLGYPETCGAAPSACTFGSPVLSAAGSNNDVLDCLACRIKEQLVTSADALYADKDATEPCRVALGNGSEQELRSTLEAVNTCAQQPAVTSVAACFTPDYAVLRSQAITACAGVDPYATLAYGHNCSGVGAVAPDAPAPHALPCSFGESTLDTAGPDNDLLDCMTCQAGEGVLGVARDLFGANLCCVGGTCNRVLTRFACRLTGGTPVRYRIDSVPGITSVDAHGIDVAADGTLYVTDDFNSRIVKRTTGGTVSVVGSTPLGFPTGVAADAAGNVYVTHRCSHQVVKISGGVTSVFAGTGTRGSSGDGGPATAAQIAAPDGIAVDPAGNVYFTESGLLSIICPGGFAGTERVRMVDTAGNIHTVAGGPGLGGAGEGGPATAAQLYLPYGLHRAFDGSLLIGEAGGERVLRVDAGGTLTRVAGILTSPVGSHSGYGGPATLARFYENCGAAGDPDGNILVSPMEDNRVALVDTLGSIIAIGGTGEGGFFGCSPINGDGGPAVLAQIGLPEDVAVAPDGKIYVSDLTGCGIRVLTREPF